MKRFINDAGAVVADAIGGLLAACGDGALCRIDAADMTVVLRSDWDRGRVAVISGGGSGHEPAHAGFVGEGMLTAAVCGEVFASPTVDAVLSAIMAVTGSPGCLLIVKNYTGDRLNFGLAAERARATGLSVEMVIVGDDVSLPDWVRPRGLAGTLFVHKLAGAAAASGADLAAVAASARDAASHVWSAGLSLSTSHGFSSAASDRLGPDEAEIGLGIHGEPGASVVPMAPARELMLRVTQLLTEGLHRPGARYAALLNNLGAVPQIEMAILAQALARSPLADRIAWIVGPGAFMTSLDMNGFSLSLLELDPEREAALLAEVAPAAWMRPRRLVAPRLVAAPALASGMALPPSSAPSVRSLVEAALALFVAMQAEIDALDSKAGDGDTGSTLALASAAVARAVDTLPYAEADKLLLAVGELLSRHAGGTSGVLLATFFTAAGTACAEQGGWVPALQAGLERMKRYGGADCGHRTMIDAIDPALRRLAEGASLREAAVAARAGAEATRTMAARSGRASYVPEASLRGTIDPGAEAAARLFERLAALERDAH